MSLNTTDSLVLRLKFITFIYVTETQREVTAKDYEIWVIQFYLVVTKKVLNNWRYKTPKKNILKYRLILNALETLIKQFFFKILHQLRLIVSSESQYNLFRIIQYTSIFSKFDLFSWGCLMKHSQEFIVSSIVPIQNTIRGTVDKSFAYKNSSPLWC